MLMWDLNFDPNRLKFQIGSAKVITSEMDGVWGGGLDEQGAALMISKYT